MSMAFLTSITFGLGVAGLLYNFTSYPKRDLMQRVAFTFVASREEERATAIRSFLANSARKLNIARSSRATAAINELPEVLDLLVVCLRAGGGVYQALQTVVPRASGALARELSKILVAVEYGSSLSNEIRKLPEVLPHPQFAELSNKVILSLVRGTSLAMMLEDQAQSVRSEIRNQLLVQAGKNETRMLVPLVFLILPVTVLFAVYPSLKLLNFGFI
jgi:tight adherence protein C